MSTKLQRLTEFLLEHRQCRKEDIDSWVDRCTLRPESSFEGKYHQLHIDHNVCSVLVERFSGNANLLKAMVTSWLQDNDDVNIRNRYELPDPSFDIEMLDKSGKRWDVDITIEFLEPLLVQEDPQGAIHWQGSRWSVIDAPIIDTATEEDGAHPEENAP
ncbi:phage tail protein [Endozoicomonas ascidiicola]|uniref:phage tail protein n=1 Tax=Endozoicomonas ascidiicola TaxID=1698521 RepID=UPI0008331060|nr:phage tail protein [Endozoicomonas ascidiicola]